jgi:F-type H+-transporting ATPase subunit c
MTLESATLISAGIVFGSYILGVARNPSLQQELFKICILGFTICEIIALMMAFLILYG